MKVFLYCLITILFLAGCSREKEVFLGNRSLSKKLVVQSYISPQDSVLIVTVRFSEALTRIISSNEGYNDLVDNAAVIISGNGNQQYSLTFKKNVGYISVPNSIPVIPDSTYFLSVTTPDGYHAESSCRVPLKNVDSSSIVLKEIKDKLYDLSWNNVDTGNQYYCLINNVVYVEGNQPPKFDNVNTWYGISNNNFSGRISTHNLRLSTKKYLSRGYMADLWICHTDFNFYEFTRTLLQQERDNQNPFGEPLPVYTNIKNGFGVFAALNKTIIYP